MEYVKQMGMEDGGCVREDGKWNQVTDKWDNSNSLQKRNRVSDD